MELDKKRENRKEGLEIITFVEHINDALV